MALAVNRPLNIIRVHCHIADSGTAGSAFTVAPCRGKIVLLGQVPHVAPTGAANVLTAKIAATSITIPTWQQAVAAAGTVSEVAPTAANFCNAGDNIEFITDGAGSTTTPTTFYADILVS